MTIEITAINFKLEEGGKREIEEKIKNLENLAKNIFGGKKFSGFFETRVKLTKVSQHHKHGHFFMAECILKFPGNEFRAKAKNENLESAVIKAKELVERQIKKAKTKRREKFEKGSRKLKMKTLEAI